MQRPCVRDINTKIGENAGKIWNTLNTQGCLNKKDLLKITKMEVDDFHSGVGWLAKDQKLERMLVEFGRYLIFGETLTLPQ
ncbi:MAG: winged helix-turn-helix domain-containing protein [Candidatus Hodarchaeota archaeon]